MRLQPAAWWGAALVALTLAVLLVHGFHPLAEDGGLYVAGVEWKLDPALFPRFTEFVAEHVRFSVFAPVLSVIARATHLPLLVVLYILFLVLPLYGIRINALTAGVLGLAINSTAFTIEIVRAGFAAIPPGQYEAARSFDN